MKKIIAMVLCLIMTASLIGCGSTNSDKENGGSQEATTQQLDQEAGEEETAAEADDEAEALGEGNLASELPQEVSVMKDFTVETITGEKFNLFDTLKEKKGVMINFWASWCPPCEMEFPYIQEAYEEYKDDIEIIALSVEPEDTNEILTQYVEDHGMTFPVGKDSTDWLTETYVYSGIPVTMMVDLSGNVVYYKIGAATSKEEFTRVFDFLAAGELSRDSSGSAYTVTVKDQDGNGVSGCVVNFCTDDSCTPVIEDEEGVYSFDGEPYAYHIQVVKVPEGYSYDTSQEYTADEAGGNIDIGVTKE